MYKPSFGKYESLTIKNIIKWQLKLKRKVECSKF